VDAATLRARLAAPPLPAPVPPARVASVGAEAVAAPLAGDDALDLAGGALTPAAVLVPFVLGAAPGVLLTKRTAHLSSHAGQVSFPGGRIDPGDASAEAAALREAEEEIGLDPARVELLGRLPPYVTGTGFRITPVLGLLPPGVPLDRLGLRPSAAEVESVFELSLSVLLDPAAPQRRRAQLRGRWREFWVWPHPEHYIWGATAGILVNLAARLRGAG
jgi:8-oxo-dGTP pyrophosphatase MutT (NUDIX family)